MSDAGSRAVLWWGRFDPAYSRNRILRRAYAELGWRIIDFRPAVSPLGDIEAVLRHLPVADLVHVPCFRQRDMAAAVRYARKRRLPLLFDPLISAWDKQVFERRKFPEGSTSAESLREWEGCLFRSADAVLADTHSHASFFAESFLLESSRLAVVHVGAEEDVFTPLPPAPFEGTLEVLFYGSFLPLQGPETVVEAARLARDLPIRWRMVGDGPLRTECGRRALGLDNLVFEGWMPYQSLVERIRRAHIVLGIFGTTPKAERVIPNKVYQAMACARPVITRASAAWPAELTGTTHPGIVWLRECTPEALLTELESVVGNAGLLPGLGRSVRTAYERFFSNGVIREELCRLLGALSL